MTVSAERHLEPITRKRGQILEVREKKKLL